MDKAQLEGFLEGTLVANLVTLRADGSPHVAPVWYQYRHGRFVVWTSEDFQKVRNIRRDPRVALSIASNEEPYRYVLAEGKASLTGEGAEEAGVEIAARYQGPERGPKYAREMFEAGVRVLVVVEPERLVAWSDQG